MAFLGSHHGRRGSVLSPSIHLVLIGLMVPVLSATGCYDPQLEGGALRCSVSGSVCPEGLTCDLDTGRCVTGGGDASGNNGGSAETGRVRAAGGTRCPAFWPSVRPLQRKSVSVGTGCYFNAEFDTFA